MSDEPDNLVLVYLRRLDEKVTRLDDRLGEMTLRINDVHAAILALRRDQVSDAESVAHVHTRIDRLAEELERIKRRLDVLPAE